MIRFFAAVLFSMLLFAPTAEAFAPPLAPVLFAAGTVEAVASDEIRVCVDAPGGLVVKVAAIGSNACPSLATPYEIIAGFIFWTQGASQFADEYSGHDLFSCFDSNGYTVFQQRDVAGPDKGAKRKTYQPAAAPVTGLVTIPSGVEDTAAAGQAQFIVLNGGAGAPYETKLASCRTLAGYPPS
jgi:hypothetical protein